MPDKTAYYSIHVTILIYINGIKMPLRLRELFLSRIVLLILFPTLCFEGL